MLVDRHSHRAPQQHSKAMGRDIAGGLLRHISEADSRGELQSRGLHHRPEHRSAKVESPEHRIPDYTPTTLAFVLELVAVIIASGTGWLGGELVSRLGVGVDDGASLDAPAKLTTGIFLKRGARRAG